MGHQANNTAGLFVAMLLAALLFVAAQALPDIRISLPALTGPSWHLQQVAPWPEFVAPAVTTAPGPDTAIWLDPGDLPPPPDCRDLGVEECEWEANWIDDDMMQLQLKAKDGRVVGRAELLRVQTAEFPELHQLARLGYREGWIARVEVLNTLRGNGIGKVVWQAGDALLRVTSGGGALRIFSDQAGWGPRIMRYVDEAAFVLRQPPLWVYVIE